MSAVSRELARQALLASDRKQDADALTWEPSLVRFPHPEMTTLSLTGRVIAPCIFAACMFGAVSQVGIGAATGQRGAVNACCRRAPMLVWWCGAAAIRAKVGSSTVLPAPGSCMHAMTLGPCASW